MTFHIRAATAEDAEAIGRLSTEFAAYLRALGDTLEFVFSAEDYLRDGFGPDPAFSGLVAEVDAVAEGDAGGEGAGNQRSGEIIGYLLYHPGYDTDAVARTLHIIDLYVRERSRRQGVGRALMAEAAAICRRLGGAYLVWSAYSRNEAALAFYDSLGAKRTKESVFMWLDV